jgi:hypothetical protein
MPRREDHIGGCFRVRAGTYTDNYMKMRRELNVRKYQHKRRRLSTLTWTAFKMPKVTWWDRTMIFTQPRRVHAR